MNRIRRLLQSARPQYGGRRFHVHRAASAFYQPAVRFSTRPSEYADSFHQSMENPVRFWAKAARELPWFHEPSKILDMDVAYHGKWFADGRTNLSYACIDRHVEDGLGDQPAIAWESPVTKTSRTITYSQLQTKVSQLASALHDKGVGRGDRVIIYMPMVPETLIAMLACVRIGAVHSVVFGGFASHEVATRIDDAKPSIILAASCGIEGERIVPYQPLLHGALEQAEHRPRGGVMVLQRQQHPWDEGSPMPHGVPCSDWDEAVRHVQREGRAAKPQPLRGDHPSYIIYTSGSTGRPKGVVRDTGGYMTALHWTMGTEGVFGMEKGDTWWAASDLGWVVGASYICYGPLLKGLTTVMFEGKPVGTPDAGEFWRVIRERNVRRMFTAPTAIRAIKQVDATGELLAREAALAQAQGRGQGQGQGQGQDGGEGEEAVQGAGGRFPLETMFLAGERADPDTVQWLARLLARARGIDPGSETAAPSYEALRMVRDQFWMTETGSPCVATCEGLGAADVKPGSAGLPVPGWDVRVLKPGQESDGAGDEAREEHAQHEAFFETDVSEHSSDVRESGLPPTEEGVEQALGHRGLDDLSLSHHSRLHPAPFLSEATDGELGPLAIRLPLPPGALMGLHDDEDRFQASYLAPFPGYFAVGDAGTRDADGYLSLMARLDDVLNVAGHRLSTGAIEAAIASHPGVAECAVVGAADELKGQVPLGVVVMKSGAGDGDGQGGAGWGDVAGEIASIVREEVGPVASLRAKQVVRVPRLPKTRSGKVLRNVMRAIADGRQYRVPATIDDPAILDEIQEAFRGIGYAPEEAK